jgi:stage III sporulation protein AA
VDTLGRDTLQELRLRLDLPPELIRSNGAVKLQRMVTIEDLSYIINTASRYSPWSAATAAHGYITAPGGHRIGLCGQAVVQGGQMSGIRQVRSLCIRVARDVPGVAEKIPCGTGSILIIGRPGSGKTTFLRDLIRQRSENCTGSVAVVDERGELFPGGTNFSTGNRTDILIGCSKGQGIDMLLRTMGPTTIAVDEITSERDCESLIRAGWCGVSLLATAHASSVDELRRRPLYRTLLEQEVFKRVVLICREREQRRYQMENL